MKVDLWKLWPEVAIWCAQTWGYRWRKRLSGTRQEREARLPDPCNWHFIDQPFGRPDWNNRFRLARFIIAGW